jgi:predicted NBD/HSP70 family sugar kinase
VRHPERAGARSETVRRSNLATILRRLHIAGAATRSDLGASTGLTRSAVGILVGELVDLGYVHEERAPSDGRPGRPSPIVRAAPHNIVLAMEVLVDVVAVAAVGLGGTVLDERRVERPHTTMPAERTVHELLRLAMDVLDGLPDGTVLHGVGVAVAGVVRRHDDTVVIAPNIGWHDVPLRDLLRRELPHDVPIAIANEGDLGALAVSRRGIAAGLDNVVYVSGEVGVGGGIIADGRPLSGAAGFAGEVGHIPVNPNGLRCECGSTGCWETEVGAEALLRRSGCATLDDVVRAADDGDEAVVRALDSHARWMAFGLAGIINVFDPDVVVLGGTFARFHPYVAATLDAELDRRVFDVVREQVEVVPSATGFDAPLLGAAEWAWESVMADPAGSVGSRVGS